MSRAIAVAVAVAAGAAVMVSAPHQAGAQDTVDGPRVAWDFSIWGPPRAFTAGIEALSKHVDERTDGKFTIKVHFGGALSAGPDNLDNLKLGAFQMAGICTSYHPGKNPGSGVLDLPFLPLSDKEVHWKVHMDVHQHPFIVEEFKRWNAMLVLSALQPQSELMGKGKPVHEIEDFKGRRIRALGGTGEAMRLLGAVPTTVQATEVYNTLERGIVEAVAFPYTYAFASYKINEISDWYTNNLAPGANNCPSLVNLDAYNKLPEQYQALIQEGKDVAFNALRTAQEAADEKNLAAWREQGLTEINYSEETLDKIREVGGTPVWEAWVKDVEAKGVPGQELLDFVLARAKEHSGS